MFSRLLLKTRTQSAGIPWLIKHRSLSQGNQTSNAAETTNNLKKKYPLPSWLDACGEIREEQIERLHDTFPQLVEDIGKLSITDELPLSKKRMQAIVRHMVPNVPNMAAQCVIVGDFYAKTAAKKQHSNDEEHTQLLYKLAWISEMIGRQVYLLDDLQDDEKVRYNENCWHTLNGTGVKAIADGLALYHCGALLLREFFRDKSYYARLLEMVNMMFFLTGSCEMELCWLTPQSAAESDYSFDRFAAGKKIINASVLFGLPTLSAMIMSGADEKMLDDATTILRHLCHYLGLVDDYSDCFWGDYEVNQRKSNDIEEGKITWPVVQALKMCNEAQRRRLKEFYGKDDEESVQIVKDIFKDVGVREKLDKIANEIATDLTIKVNQLDPAKYPCKFWLGVVHQLNTLRQGKCSRI